MCYTTKLLLTTALLLLTTQTQAEETHNKSPIAYTQHASLCSGIASKFTSDGVYVCIEPAAITTQSGARTDLTYITAAHSLSCSETSPICAVAGQFFVEFFTIIDSKATPLSRFYSLSSTLKPYQFQVIEWIQHSNYLLAGKSTSKGLLRLDSSTSNSAFGLVRLTTSGEDNPLSSVYNIRKTKLALVSSIGKGVVYLLDVVTMTGSSYINAQVLASPEASLKPKLFSEVDAFAENSWVVMAAGDVKLVQVPQLQQLDSIYITEGAGFQGLRGYKGGDVVVGITFEDIFFFQVEATGKIRRVFSQTNQFRGEALEWSETHRQMLLVDNLHRAYFFEVVIPGVTQQICNPGCSSCSASFSHRRPGCQCGESTRLMTYNIGEGDSEVQFCEVKVPKSFKEGAVQTFGALRTDFGWRGFNVTKLMGETTKGDGEILGVKENKARSSLLIFILFGALIAIVSLVGYLLVSCSIYEKF